MAPVMRGLGLFLSARSAPAVSALWLRAIAISVPLVRRAIPVDYAHFNPPRDIPVIEFVPIVTGCLVAGLLRPRMYEWERLAIRPPSVLCGLLTLASIAFATVPVYLAALRLPARVPWQFIPANVAAVTALAFILTALLGAVTGGLSTLVLFLASCLAQNLIPGIAGHIPLGNLTHPEPHWLATGLICLASALIIGITRGASAYSRTREP